MLATGAVASPSSNNNLDGPPLPAHAPPSSVSLRLLSNFYSTVQPLVELLPKDVAVSREGDSDEYRLLVGESLVASTALTGLPSLHVRGDGVDEVTMPEIIEQVHHRIFDAHAKDFQRERKAGRPAFATPKNVLALGYRLLSNSSSRSLHRTTSGIHAAFTSETANPIVRKLCTSLAWNKLVSRIGADAMLALLASPDVALFTPLPNACYLQVSGVPISEHKLREPAGTDAGKVTSTRTVHRPRKRRRRRRRRDEAGSSNEEGKTTGQDSPWPETQPMIVDEPASPVRPLPRIEQSPTKRLRSTQSSVGVFGGSEAAPTAKRRKLETLHSANSIVSSRHRMYHARLAKADGGKIPYGLPVKHVLTRLPSLFPPPMDSANKAMLEAPARHLAKYLFPRQFGMHNVFTSPKAKSAFEVLPDYLDREVEIKKLGAVKTPSRLIPALPLLSRLALLNARCKYRKVLDRAILELAAEPRTQVSRGDVSIDISHASLVVPHGQTQAEERQQAKPKLAQFACSFYGVERFVESVTRDVIPRAFWGSDDNYKVIRSHISAFVRMRRYETTSLHVLMQGFSVLDCDWLAGGTGGGKGQRVTAADMEKRRELLGEFLYWFFDGFVIDLIRTSFYVTDSATHQNRPLYFRQDDWTALSAPLLEQLGQSVFEKVPTRNRQLGYSYVRLLPKETGVRPIVNLARRPLKSGANGQKEVGQPINMVLRSVFDVLTFEKARKPHLVGSLVSDPQQIYAKLRLFKQRMLAKHGGEMPKLYFVKVDVRAAYDTIQQDKLLEIVENVLSEAQTIYWIRRYSQVSPLAGKATKAFKRAACSDADMAETFTELAEKLAQELHNVVLVDAVKRDDVERDSLMQLLREHITTNLVSGRLYRQKTGIPQGSILSSLLCSLFYGDMEQRKLAFTNDENSTLLRYVDDFLFISTERERAGRFLRTMDDGIPEYGCNVSAEKRLTNFDIALADGEVVPPLPVGEEFPWCGLMIDTKTLEVGFDTSRTVDKDIQDALTIQRYRKPGQAFLNAMFRAVKLRATAMYTDTSHNSPATVYGNVYRAMLVVALKLQAYVQQWGIEPLRKVAFLYKVINQVINYEWSALVNQSRSRKARKLGVEFSLKRSWVVWLCWHAFRRVLSRRPAVYAPLLDLVGKEVGHPALRSAKMHLGKIVTGDDMAFADRANGDKRARRA
ncbi:hypothetical protein Rhopal_004105-T1 [Rhodotorula paludigena]|uniref:Telomerase reverse transcriptase n=1 Tax=Rhodotorula paludigena TaxID=86838 RepID=A0AAV5GQY3_9BASI|nr:hypothetical protein Rhopal_004105-T1 [Rhodotorula paludigena]